ncbi:MAG: N-formylglutamate amidohydrolase [Kiloniellaceae bacterium]
MSSETGAEAKGGSLLAAEEPAPYELYNEAGRAPVLLLCDHASRRLPRALGTLGLSEAELLRHVAWDIGIAEVTRALAERLDAPAVLSRFSRLIVDPNRALDDPTLIPRLSDGVIVPGNRDLSPAAVRARVERFHRPYHAAIDRMLDALAARAAAPAVVSMHSFTPVMKGFERPWHVGVLWNEDPRLPLPLMAKLRAQGLSVGDNEPYSGRDGHGYTLHVHAEPRGLAHALIEVRQDLIDTHHGAAEWAERLSGVLGAVLDDPAVRRTERDQ